jgi:uncharacterized membrane protein YfcA
MLAAWLPDGLSTAAAILLVFASFFTSLLTASFGIGGGLVLLSVMTYLLPVTALIPVHGAVQFGSNAGRAVLRRHLIAWPELFAFMAGGAIGAFAGAHVVLEMPEFLLEIVLGLFVLTVTWIRPPRMGRMSLPSFALTGAVTTFLTMFFGATGPLNVAAFEKTFPDRRVMVASLAALQTSQHVLKLLAFGFAGFSFAAWVPLMASMILTGLAGTWVGLRLLGIMHEETFRFALKLIMTVIGLDMLRRGFGLI